MNTLSKELLPRARFPIDHNCKFRISKTFSQIFYSFHGIGTTYNIRKRVLSRQALFMKLNTNILLCGLQQLNVLKSSHNALNLFINNNGNAISRNQSAINIHQLIQLHLAASQNISQTRIWQYLINMLASIILFPRGKHFSGYFVCHVHQAFIIYSNNSIMAIIQNIIKTL